jgi:hypothetical protein
VKCPLCLCLFFLTSFFFSEAQVVASWLKVVWLWLAAVDTIRSRGPPMSCDGYDRKPGAAEQAVVSKVFIFGN